MITSRAGRHGAARSWLSPRPVVRPRGPRLARARGCAAVAATSSCGRCAAWPARRRGSRPRLRAVFQLAAAGNRARSLVAGTTYPATAEIPKKMQPSRLTAGIHQPRPFAHRPPAQAPERHGRRSRPRRGSRSTRMRRGARPAGCSRGSRGAVSIPWNVVTLKSSVPADWITADHQSARRHPVPAPGEGQRRLQQAAAGEEDRADEERQPVAAAPTSCA